MCCLSGFGNSASRVASRRGVLLHGFCHAWNFQCRSLALDFPTAPSLRPSDRDRGGATWSRPPPPWGSRGRRAAECSRGAGQRVASERLSLGWLLNRNLKAILTSISLHVDDKSLHVSTSKSGVSILKRTLIVEGCLHPDSLQGSYSHCPLINSYRRYRKFRGCLIS